MPETQSHPQPVQYSRPDVNWDIVKVLYLQDIPHAEISAQSGASVHAIRTRAYRERWTAQKLNPQEPPQPPSLQDLVQEFQLNMALSVVGATKYYSNRSEQPTDGKDARDWETARETLIRSGRMLFGLDKDDGKPSNAWKSGAGAGPVIDVTPTPLPDVTQQSKPA